MAYIHPPYFITAYEIAVKNGFTGTEENWLESIHGVQYKHSIEITDGDYRCHVDFYDNSRVEISKTNLDRLGTIGARGKVTADGSLYDILHIKKVSGGVRVTYFTTGILTSSITFVTTDTEVTDTITEI